MHTSAVIDELGIEAAVKVVQKTPTICYGDDFSVRQFWLESKIISSIRLHKVYMNVFNKAGEKGNFFSTRKGDTRGIVFDRE